jgi:hypothetical protein
VASPGLITDREELESLFHELAEELQRLRVTAEIVMVGGSWMLWHSQRAATRDVDSARQFETDLSEAIDRVGLRHQLQKAWLNDAASAYWPSGHSFDDCEIVYRQEALVVRTPSPDILFVMKLYRADPQDREDLVSLWPICSFAAADEAARAFQRAYPHAPDDEHLADYVREIARDADRA